jgi:hypothetical protein
MSIKYTPDLPLNLIPKKPRFFNNIIYTIVYIIKCILHGKFTPEFNTSF